MWVTVMKEVVMDEALSLDDWERRLITANI